MMAPAIPSRRVQIAAWLDVLGPEPEQLAESDAGVGEHPDDQLVPLVGSRVLQVADVLATEHLDDTLRDPLALDPGDRGLSLPLLGQPHEERVDGAGIAVHRGFAERPAGA